MAVTLAEIAALAGVSRGTVDRALNDRGRVDPKVAARVRRIAAERGYRPNRAGRMLARAKNPIRIGVIVQSVETMFMHTVFEEIERASAHFTTTGAEVLVRPLEGVDAQQQLDVIDELLEAGVQVNQAGHDGGQTLVDDLFLGVAQAQLLGLPDVANDAVAHEDRAIDDGLGRNRQDILGTQKHGTSQFMRGVFN